ncbi:glycosyl hydrolase 115 family protein [Gramella sp. GC03-9]|uniref:Glycosyl hydrolase 115 family protein n=1 Tax=Christiangramia oceanisediminis TaxID=2920386 RepID=A0A9X2KWB7_9FLAO|nr:glycosyl hydrolase 115 family protein [Gramella oceanisediminis]MCP9199124.1 glycosyl hydrolase 115 family protein [Gramella oceanisediminis]
MKKIILFLLVFPFVSYSQISVSNQKTDENEFALVDRNSVASILYDSEDEKLIDISANFFADDVQKVTGKGPELITSTSNVNGNLVIIGSIGNSRFIDDLIEKDKIDISEIRGDWERFIIQTVQNPYPGVEQALVIAGSDKRGTAYGVFTLSKEIGVSPWYWWADAPVQKKQNLFVQNKSYVAEGPSVKYRGIFINDEAPALTNWARENYGGFNHEFYEKVFELILRNKGNYLWPAMWRPTVFATDDPENLRLADEYGIVISTSHHEPMMRYHEEWDRYDAGEWNYETNAENLQKFWRGGIERMGDYESVVTVGMRGDGDEAMGEGTAVNLLKRIIADQRTIIEDVTGKPAEETPQVWALYKEVQDYYDKGMRVDDDILILLADDNWGNVRILPKKEDLDHKGGYGMYYHFDFVGGPVSYRFLNVTQIEKVWEQMNLAYEWGVEDLWIVNVGDIKPMELPISFFLDFAWNAEMKAQDLPDYYKDWATQQFGEDHAEEIAGILSDYTKYSARRTPEMLKPDTYSLDNYREAERILSEYEQLLKKSRAIYKKLPETHQAAFYQLVLFPIEMSSNLNQMYVAAAKNNRYAMQDRASTNMYAEKVKERFFKDAELTKYYHDTLANGKWNHMMAQNHIGYTSWNEPSVNRMPKITYIQNQDRAGIGYVLENGESSRWNPGGLNSKKFSPFDPINDQEYYIEIFNRGKEKLDYSLNPKNDWIQLSSKSGMVEYEEKVFISIDWDRVPKDTEKGELVLSGAGQEFNIEVPLRKDVPEASGFVEDNGVISIEAANFTNKINSEDISWTVVPNMGRTNSAVIVEPANAERQTPGPNTPHLEYEFTIFDEGDLKIDTYLSPTLNFKKNEGLKYAIAIDDAEPQIINIHEGDIKPDWEYPEWWNKSVTDHIRIKPSEHKNIKAGTHTLKIWMVDPGVVFQKFVIDAGGLKPSYLGPPESKKVE